MTSRHDVYGFQELPDLRILPAEHLLPHEEHDTQRSGPLVRRFKADGVLRNPPIAAPIPGDDRFVLLDGANRVSVLEALEFPHVLAQVIDYEDPALRLTTWHHLVSGFSGDEFQLSIERLPQVQLAQVSLVHAQAELAQRQALAYLVYPDSRVFTIRVSGDLRQRTARLNDIVNVYKARGKIFRVSTDQLDELRPYHADISVLVVFPHYQPAEIIELVRVGARLPAGITRHIIPGRALRVNFPLDWLRAATPIAEKNLQLQAWLKAKVANNEMRFYQESTFLFDE